jgi:hypothetical protein
MALLKHLEEAAERLKKASARIEEARAKPATPETLRSWLEALTDYSMALSDLHDLNTEAIEEKLEKLARRQHQSGAGTL